MILNLKIKHFDAGNLKIAKFVSMRHCLRCRIARN